jgi:transcriptional repressor NrdR
MYCPFCGYLEDKVVDSRLSKDGRSIRRRRECLKCNKRYTTYEYIEEVQLNIIKSSGAREPFSREKLIKGVITACKKRPVSTEKIEEMVDNVERNLMSLNLKEVPSKKIGELVMKGLKKIDEVAYVRFASVYRKFKDKSEFMEELKGLLK